MIPLVDLKTQYLDLKTEIDEAIQDVIDNTAFIGGERIKQFEDAFAQVNDAKFCIGTSSGTDALHLILWSLGVGQCKDGVCSIGKDEVIVPTNTFIASAEAIYLSGATPVFVDCDETYTMDVEKFEKAITLKTKAVMPVHLYGQPAKMVEIKRIADENNLAVIEDCCQAHLAEYHAKKVGNFGIAGAFSFYPAKNLGAFGEGGAVITNNESLHNEMRLRHNHGRSITGHNLIGHNYRLEGIQAAVLQVKLPHLERWNILRRRNAECYRKSLADIAEIMLPPKTLSTIPVYHLFVVRAQRRDELRNYLDRYGISTGIHYKTPLHLLKAFEYLGGEEGDCPVAEKSAQEILSLPMYPELSEADIHCIASHIWTFYHI